MNHVLKVSRLGTRVRASSGRVALVVLLVLLTSLRTKAGLLTVGPDYRRPTNSLPAQYKAAEFGTWKEGTPLDQVPRGDWWKLFDDDGLNRLETEAVSENQNLKAALARLNEARATARVARGAEPGRAPGPGWSMGSTGRSSTVIAVD